MTDTTHVAADPREDLRRQWLEHAGAVFDRLFPAGDAPTPTFDQLEQRTCNLSTDLAGWLLPHVVTRAPLVEAIYSGLVTSGAAPSADLRARLIAEARRLRPGVRAGVRPSPPRGARRMRFIAGTSLTTAQ